MTYTPFGSQGIEWLQEKLDFVNVCAMQNIISVHTSTQIIARCFAGRIILIVIGKRGTYKTASIWNLSSYLRHLVCLSSGPVNERGGAHPSASSRLFDSHRLGASPYLRLRRSIIILSSFRRRLWIFTSLRISLSISLAIAGTIAIISSNSSCWAGATHYVNAKPGTFIAPSCLYPFCYPVGC